MKTALSKLLKSRLARMGALLVVTAAVAASIAWSDPQGRVKLGGTWVGRFGDITWTGTYSPDSSGQNATSTLQWMTLSAEFEALNASIGADHLSMASGHMSMVSTDTAKGELIWYSVKGGTPSVTNPVPGQVKAIAVMANEWHFTSPTTAVGKHNLKMYLLDAQGSLVPNETNLFLNVDFDNVPHVRIFPPAQPVARRQVQW